MKAKTGEALLISGIILTVIGAIGFVAGFLPQSTIVVMGFLALFFVGTGASMKR